jgi:hypothetical protein
MTSESQPPEGRESPRSAETESAGARCSETGEDRRSENGAGRRRGEPCGRRRQRGHRKERVLHTRISEPLAEEIRRMAEDLRLPVSNLVRNVLEEAFSVVEAVTDNVGDLIDDVADEAERARGRIRSRRQRGRHPHRRHRHARGRPGALDEEPASGFSRGAPPEREPFPDVVGWQPLILNQPQSCADCEEPIERSERGFAGMTAAGRAEVYLCRDCMDARR